MPPMEDCIFCKIASGAVPSSKIWEDGVLFAFLDINPINPGHTLIIPKAHAENVFDLDNAEYAAIFKAAKALSFAIQKATHAERIGVIIEGFAVSHAHIHLVPLNSGGELSFSRAKPASKGELDAMSARIKKHL